MISFNKSAKSFYLSVSNGFLQVIKGEVKNKKLIVDSFALGKIPLDTFKNGEIVQKELFGKMAAVLVKNSWPRPIKSNFCHLVIPDQFVFSKILTIPKIKKQEINQAIKFKIKNYLPHSLEKMDLDWQLLDDNSTKIEVLVMAVEKKIIDSYFKALKLVNIYPLSFQSESLALAYLAGLNSIQPALVVFSTETAVCLAFVEKKGVLFATTFNLSPLEKDDKEIIAEIESSAKFWRQTFAQKKKISHIYFSGVFNNQLLILEALKKNFKLKPIKLKVPVVFPKKIPQSRLARLVPLFGLSFSQTEENQAKKITLIPQEIKTEREKFKFSKKIKNILRATAVVILGLISLYVFVFLKIFFDSYKVRFQLSGLEKIVFTAKQTQLEKKSLLVNQKIDALGEVLAKENIISDFLLLLNQKIPAGITITEIDLSPIKKTVKVKGIAKTRKDILALDSSFSSLGKVNIPLSNFQNSQNIEFVVNIFLKNKQLNK